MNGMSLGVHANGSKEDSGDEGGKHAWSRGGRRRALNLTFSRTKCRAFIPRDASSLRYGNGWARSTKGGDSMGVRSTGQSEFGYGHAYGPLIGSEAF